MRNAKSVASLALCLATSLASGGLATAAQAAQTFDVADRPQLTAALAAAKAGDSIRLAPGFYGDMNWDRLRFTGGQVFIYSADPSDRARFGQIRFGKATGMALTGVDVQTTLTPAVSISGSDILFAGNRIRGAIPNKDPWDDSNSGVHVRFAKQVAVVSNDFQDLRTALYIQQTEDVVVRHNSFGYLREGVNVATVTRADFSNNYFYSFMPNYGRGEHPDAMQFWNRNEPTGSSYVKISNNFFSLGNKGAVHGIFLGTEHKDKPHSHFEVSGNIYYGSALHGISLGYVNDTKIFNNVVTASPWADLNDSSYDSPDGREGGALQPHLRLGMGVRVESFRNVATVISAVGPERTSVDNINLWDSNTKKGEPVDSVLLARPTADLPQLSEFLTRKPSFAATMGIGLMSPYRAGVVTLDPLGALRFAQQKSPTPPRPPLQSTVVQGK